MWDHELLHHVIKGQVGSSRDSGLYKLMSQTFETMCPLKEQSEGTVTNSEGG